MTHVIVPPELLCSMAAGTRPPTHVAVGMTGPFTGLQAEYGARIAAGLRTAFAEANAAGGVRPGPTNCRLQNSATCIFLQNIFLKKN